MSPRSPTGRRARLALPFLVVATVVAGCGRTPPPNLVLVVVDTLRADRLGVYGYPGANSPAIDAFAASGARFERAYATAPWTIPSVASMLTGLHAGGHGITGERHRLSPQVTTVAERLQAAGWATAGVVSNMLLSRGYGFDQGFARFEDSAIGGARYVSTPEVTAQALELLAELAAGDAPFFLFVHYFDPHYLYTNHRDVELAPRRVGRLNGRQSLNDMRDMSFTDAEVRFLHDLYDEEVRFTDRGIGDLLAAVDGLGPEAPTAVVLTADHGEELLERGWIGHTRTLYDEVVRVPLLVRLPGVAPRTVRRPVSLVSITPTLLDVAGLDAADAGLEGPSLLPLVRGEALTPPPPFIAVDFVPRGRASQMKRAVQRGVVVGDLKLIRDDLAGETRLFDLTADPEERHDLAAERAELAARLYRQLEGFAQAPAAVDGEAEPEMTDEELEQLRALGYG